MTRIFRIQTNLVKCQQDQLDLTSVKELLCHVKYSVVFAIFLIRHAAGAAFGHQYPCVGRKAQSKSVALVRFHLLPQKPDRLIRRDWLLGVLFRC